MKYGKTLALLSFLGLFISLYYFGRFWREFPPRTSWLRDVQPLWILAGLLLHISGHLLRAMKSKLLLDPIRPVRFSKRFSAMAIGYWYNAILPFRMGEFVRAHMLGKSCFISRVSILLTILFERAVDGLILAAVTLLVAANLGRHGMADAAGLPWLALPILASTVAIALFFWLLHAQPAFLLRSVAQVTGIFNDRLRDQLRFHVWSAGYSVRLVSAKASLRSYLLLSIAMWALYGAGIWCVWSAFPNPLPAIARLAMTAGSYLSVAVPSGPAYLGTYHYLFTQIGSHFLPRGDTLFGMSLLSWGFLILPISLAGLCCLPRFRMDKPDVEQEASDPRANKLYRHADISVDISDFLESYFDCGGISKVITESEIKDDFRLVKLFQGGSNAATMLAQDAQQTYVRKMALARHSSKLQWQHDWLKQRQRFPYYPRVLRDGYSGSAYFFDLELAAGYAPFFDFIHANELKLSEAVVDSVLQTLRRDLYQQGVAVYSPERVQEYLDIKVVAKFEDACAMSGAIAALAAFPKLVVNASEFDNLTTVLKRIQTSARMMSDLAHFNEFDVHGDLTVDNLLVGDGRFILLDPNGENLISDMLVDVAKLYQSFHSGYEFLRLLTAVSVNQNQISFSEKISSKYVDLFKFLDESMRRQLTPERYRAILFHEAVHYLRMLTYRVRLNEATAPAFYAIAVRLFNQFAAQYE